MSGVIEKIGGIVLCGGKSTRMGECKAWLTIGSECALQRVVRIVSGEVRPVVVAGRPGQELPPLPADVRVVHDAVTDAGPLAGIAAGLAALEGEVDAAFVCSCDHPLLRSGFIRAVAERSAGGRAVVPLCDGRRYPLTAVYPLSARVIADEQLAHGNRRVTSFAERCDPVLIDADGLRDVDPSFDSLLNVNDPEQYDEVLRRVRG